MSLTPGSRIGPYEIGAQIGVGGMGEVYRATDRNLKRRVAIKVLPEAVAADAERLARFQREAEVLASLNHPHIAAIYGLERAGSATALVMELVDGPTLADRIAEGPIALDEALAIAKQIAEALEVAHEQGVIHRDLKPANIKVRPDGTVKVLDFGLAKVAESTSAAGVDVTASPTITSPAMTSVGIILGTAAYMSPEQARGKPVDKRADIWAFGCVLYEMLAGRRAFDGETISDTIAAVLDRQPNWSALPPTTPTNIHRLLERCLAKTGKGRLRDVGDARLELDEALTSGHAAPLPMLNAAPGTVRRSRSVVLIAATIVAVALGALAFTVAPTLLKSVPLDTSRYRFTPLAAEPADENSPSWSPDGRSVAYVADVDGVKQVFRRALDSALSTQITKFLADAVAPFWSPDGTRIYFASPFTLGGDLYAVGATGGDAQLVMKDAGAATIAPDGKTLVFLRGRGGRRSLYIAGIPTGDPQPYRTSPFPETFTRSDSVEFSRDGTKIGVLVEQQEGPSFRSELWVIPYPSGTPRRVLARARDVTGGRISWLPDNRHIVLDSVFLDRPDSHLYVADTESGSIRPITAGTVEERNPAVALNGDQIAFATGGTDFDLVRIPVDGSEMQTLLASARSETRPTWSPTGGQVAYVTNSRGTPEIWVRSVEEGWARPIVKRDPEGVAWANLNRPSFSPDGQRIVYEVISSRHAIWVSSVADGRGVPLDSESPDQHSPAWSPDGRWIAYQRLQGPNWELVKVPSGGGQPVKLAEAPPGGGDQSWSPSGEWIAHVYDGALRLTSTDNSQAQRLLTRVPPVAFGFSPDGLSLYGVRNDRSDSWVLVAIDVQSGKERKISDLKLPSRATLAGFSLHPSGKNFATAIGIARHDIWILEKFEQPYRW